MNCVGKHSPACHTHTRDSDWSVYMKPKPFPSPCTQSILQVCLLATGSHVVPRSTTQPALVSGSGKDASTRLGKLGEEQAPGWKTVAGDSWWLRTARPSTGQEGAVGPGQVAETSACGSSEASSRPLAPSSVTQRMWPLQGLLQNWPPSRELLAGVPLGTGMCSGWSMPGRLR